MDMPHRASLLPLVSVALLSACAGPARTSTWSIPARVFQSSQPTPTRARNLRPSPRSAPAAALVERYLHERGLRFGTDGTIGALVGYLHDNGRRVSAGKARAGDVVFFALRDEPGCQDHVGVVEAVDADGRIAFRESRDGSVRRSYVHAGVPSSRRDAAGRILNTFLRPKRPDDAPQTRYFAGELLCAVFRPLR